MSGSDGRVPTGCWRALAFVVPAVVAITALLVVLALPSQASFAAVGNQRFHHSENGIVWTQPFPEFTTTLNGLAHGNGAWVAVGAGGAIYHSLNGIDWSLRASGTTQEFTDVTYGGGLFVAVGPSMLSPAGAAVQAVYTSPDGVTWTQNPTPVSYNNVLRSVAYGNGQYVAVGNLGVMAASLDGATWSPRGSGTTSTLFGVAFGGGQFTAVGVSGATLTSTDGAAWIARTAGTTATLYSVTWGGNTWVSVGTGGAIRTSTDNGLTWVARSSGISATPALYGVAYGGGRFVAVSSFCCGPNATSYSGSLITSLDGITWSPRPVSAYFLNGPRAVAHDGSMWVGVGTASVVRSVDGLDWVAGHAQVMNARYALQYNGTHWVSGGNFGSIFTSADGQAWTARHSGQSNGKHVTGVAWGAGTWVAVGATVAPGMTCSGSNFILTSRDGMRWTEESVETTEALCGVAYGPGHFVAVGVEGTLLVSTDGKEWTAQYSGTSRDLWGVAYGGGQWTVVGAGGVLRWSTDTAQWVAPDSGPVTAKTFFDVAYDSVGASSRWVAVGEDGVVAHSADGRSWSLVGVGSATLHGVTSQAGQWVAVPYAPPYAILGSGDGITWSTVHANAGSAQFAVGSTNLPDLECKAFPPRTMVDAPVLFGAYGGRWPYAWDAPGESDGGPEDGGHIIRTYSMPGEYTVKLMDATTASTECKVTVEAPPPEAPLCAPAVQDVPPGIASVQALAGVPPYSWSVSPSLGVSPASGAGTDSFQADFATEGSHTITLTGANGSSTSCIVNVRPNLVRGCGYSMLTTATAPDLYDFTDIDPAVGGGGIGLGTPALNFYHYGQTVAIRPTGPPMQFPFCGKTYQTFWLSLSGMICLDSTTTTASGTYGTNTPVGCGEGTLATPLPGAGAPDGAIYGLWAPYNVNFGCNGLVNQFNAQTCVFYKFEGAAPDRVLIYEFKGVNAFFDANAMHTWQLKLFEATGCIEAHYQSTPQPRLMGTPSSAGYEDDEGRQGYQHFHAPRNTAHPVLDGQAWRACPFVAMSDAYTFNEDQPHSFDVMANDRTAVPAVLDAYTLPTKGTLTHGADGRFTYTPFPDATGMDSFSYRIAADGLQSTGRVSITIQAVNDAPSFELGGTTIEAPVGRDFIVPGWASQVRAGPTTAIDEASQTVVFDVASNSNPALFAEPVRMQRALAADSLQRVAYPNTGDYGVLSLRLAGIPGSSTVCLVARDPGGTGTQLTANLMPQLAATGRDTSEPRCFQVVARDPPVAYFEASAQWVAPGQLVAFDACPRAPPECSHDPGGHMVQLLWDFGDGERSEQVAPVHSFETPGVYDVQLRVQGEGGGTASFARRIHVAWQETEPPEVKSLPPTPIADAGPDRTEVEGTVVVLQGSQLGGSDATTFAWHQEAGPSVPLVGRNTASPSFTAPRDMAPLPVDLLFSLRVKDGGVTSRPDHVVVRITSANHAPAAEAGPTQVVQGGAVVVLDGSASDDSDGDALTFGWVQVDGPAIGLRDGETHLASFVAPPGPAELRFRLRVSDGRAAAQDEVAILVEAPVVLVREPLAFHFDRLPSGEYRFQAEGVGVRWDFGDGDEATGSVVLHRFLPGTYTVTMTVLDGEDTRTWSRQVHVPAEGSVQSAGAVPAPAQMLPSALILAAALALAFVVVRRWRRHGTIE